MNLNEIKKTIPHCCNFDFNKQLQRNVHKKSFSEKLIKR